jgi:predicted esterase
MNQTNLHDSRIAATAGTPLDKASAALIMIHGRGDSAQGILGLAREFPVPGLAFVAPEARGNVWYPYSFLEPLERNEPWLGSALEVIGSTVQQLVDAGLPFERIALLGFSQGACLATEFAARNPRRYGAVIGLSGGLIGPPGMDFEYPGSLEGTPVFLGCSDIDAHIPVERVNETAQVLAALGAAVEERIYPGMGHTVNHDEVRYVTGLLQELVAGPAAH